MIAVWGANGFIGRHIMGELIGGGKVINACSRSFDGFPYHNGFHKTEADFCDLRAYAGQLRSCDSLVLLVTQSLSRTFDSIEQEVKLNVEPYGRLFDVLKQQDKKPHVVYVSSGGAVYGDPAERFPISEEHPLSPISVYGRGKSMIEQALIAAADDGGFPYTIIRPSNPVGTWGRNLVSYALGAAKSGSEFTVYGDGSAIRDYFGVADMARGISDICERAEAHNKIYNMGCGYGLSVNNVLNLVEEISGRKIKKHYVDAPFSDVHYNVLNCQKIYNELGWSAKRSLDHIITEMWKELCEY